jgi:hypothetical protein
MEQGLLFDVVALTPAAASKMHATGKHWLFNSLLNGCYIMERGGHSKRYQHCLFELNSVPVKKISREQWKSVKHLVREKKVRGHSKYFINLKEVRSLHGNYSFKRLYRKYRQQHPSKKV